MLRPILKKYPDGINLTQEFFDEILQTNWWHLKKIIECNCVTKKIWFIYILVYMLLIVC